MNQKRLDWDFSYHPPATPERQASHEIVRNACIKLAEFLNQHVPDSREKSLAITKLEEVMFWANAAIARADRPEDAA